MARVKTLKIQDIRDRLLWEVRRWSHIVLRRFGWVGISLVVGVLAIIPAWYQLQRATDQYTVAQKALVALGQAPMMPHQETRADAVERLKAFETLLLAREDIPDTLQSLFLLAEEEHLTLKRGEYKIDPDAFGGFDRYRMILPVKGDAQSIYRFMHSALLAHKALALESVQFRRERIESKDVEARIHWVLLTQVQVKPTMKVSAQGAQP